MSFEPLGVPRTIAPLDATLVPVEMFAPSSPPSPRDNSSRATSSVGDGASTTMFVNAARYSVRRAPAPSSR